MTCTICSSRGINLTERSFFLSAGLANLRRRIRAMKDRKKERMLSEGHEVVDSSSTDSSTDTESISDQVSLHVLSLVVLLLSSTYGGCWYNYSGYGRPLTHANEPMTIVCVSGTQ